MALPASILLLLLFAQETAPGPATDDARARAQVLVKRGARAYRQAQYQEALVDFRKAYGIFPSPKLLLNLGQAHQGLGHPIEAIDFFEQFLELAPDAPEPAIAEAKRSLAALVPQVGQLLVEGPAPGAEITLDGRKIGSSPLQHPVRVLPGRHQVAATMAGGSAATKTIEIQAGLSETVVLRSFRVTETAARKPRSARPEKIPTITRSSAPVAPRDSGWWLGRKWTWIAAGSAVLFAAGATTAGLTMDAKYTSLDQRCGRSAGQNYTGCASSDFATLDGWKNTANVLWGLTAAATVTAGVLFYVEGRSFEVSPVAGTMIGLQAKARY